MYHELEKTIALAVIAGALLLAPGSSEGNTSGVSIPEKPKFQTTNPATYGTQLAQYAEAFDTGWRDMYSKSQMTLLDARGDSVKRAVTQKILEGNTGDKSMVRFMSPAEIRGVAALIHENPRSTDDSWLYLPSSRRVRRVSGANRTASFQGTEFTYEDLSSLIVERYQWKYLGSAEVERKGKKQPVFLLEARPTYKDTAYSRLVISLNQQLWRPEKIEFYDKSGQLLKTLENTSWAHLHERFWRARRVSMVNHQTRKKTVIDVSAMFVNLSLYKKKNGSARANLGEQNFTRRVLGKGG